MSLNVLARNPQFKIRVVTQNGEIKFADLRPSIIDFTVNHRMGDAAGSFSITLLPRMPPAMIGKSWIDVISPMDFVEIWAWVPPDMPVPPMAPLIRGFVDTVSERFGIASGQPQRHIQIAGRDFGQIALISNLYYLTDQVVSIAILKRWKKGFDKLSGQGQGGDGNTKPPESTDLPELDDAGEAAYGELGMMTGPATGGVYTPKQVMQLIFDEFFNPAQKDICGTRFALSEFKPQVDADFESTLHIYSPQYNLNTSRPMTDMWNMFRTFQHWPWRELFFEEGPTAPVLIYRPAPWLDLHGGRIQEWTETVVEHKIVDAMISDIAASRSHANVKNYFFTSAWAFGFAQAAKQVPGLIEGSFIDPFMGNPFLCGYRGADEYPDAPIIDGSMDASSYQRYGFRIREEYTPYLNMELGLKRKDVENKLANISRVGLVSNKRLAHAFGHEELLENGTMVLRGDPHIRIGHYITRTDKKWTQYAEAVTQYFRQGNGPSDGLYQTTVAFTRGRGHLVRSGRTQV